MVLRELEKVDPALVHLRWAARGGQRTSGNQEKAAEGTRVGRMGEHVTKSAAPDSLSIDDVTRIGELRDLEAITGSPQIGWSSATPDCV